jgi:hypothetical protein
VKDSADQLFQCPTVLPLPPAVSCSTDQLFSSYDARGIIEKSRLQFQKPLDSGCGKEAHNRLVNILDLGVQVGNVFIKSNEG